MFDIERKKELDKKLNELLIEFQDVIGPEVCSIHGDEDCDCPAENYVHKEGWSLPVDTVVISLWMDSSDDTYLDVLTPDRQAHSRASGLLIDAMRMI